MPGEIQVGHLRKVLLQKSGQALEWAAQGGAGVTIPSGVQEKFRCCTKGHGSVGNIGRSWVAGLNDLGGLFQLR